MVKKTALYICFHHGHVMKWIACGMISCISSKGYTQNLMSQCGTKNVQPSLSADRKKPRPLKSTLCKDGNMIDKPKFTQFSGEGIFTSGDYRIDMRFTVQLQFSHIVFEAEGDDHNHALFLQFGKKQLWSLSGQLVRERGRWF